MAVTGTYMVFQKLLISFIGLSAEGTLYCVCKSISVFYDFTGEGLGLNIKTSGAYIFVIVGHKKDKGLSQKCILKYERGVITDANSSEVIISQFDLAFLICG